MNKNEWLIDEKNHHQRLDNFLLFLLKERSKSYVYKLIRQGQVRVNKSRAKAMQKLNLGDVVRLPPFLIDEMQQSSNRINYDTQVNVPNHSYPIIFQDEHYLIIDKPYGVPVHSGSGHDYGIIDVLRVHHNYHYLELAHRLDKDTSGCLILAKTRNALVALQNLMGEKSSEFTDHSVIKKPLLKKEYLALMNGVLSNSIEKVDDLVKTSTSKGERVSKVYQGDASLNLSKEARSHFKPIQYFTHSELGDFTLASVRIYTGRTHQIRVQSQEMDLPIAGDKKYGDWSMNKKLASLGLKRMFLHAHRLSFVHPVTDETIVVEAPQDDAFENIGKIFKIKE